MIYLHDGAVSKLHDLIITILDTINMVDNDFGAHLEHKDATRYKVSFQMHRAARSHRELLVKRLGELNESHVKMIKDERSEALVNY